MTGAIRILNAGPMMTVQDGGRRGFLRFGVSGSGPMDRDAFEAANALVGNAPDAAGVEFALIGGRLSLADECLIAVTGGDVPVALNGKPISPWSSWRASAGSELEIGAMRSGVWGYIAVSGGVTCPLVMGSRSTHLRSGVGGLDGRVLRTGDVLPLGSDTGAEPKKLVKPIRLRGGPISLVPGPQDDYFDADAFSCLFGREFQVSQQRDRMAMMLDGPEIHAAGGHDIVSDGTLMGSIQVPPSGRLIVLMADRQTTGGFPKIATVASADLGRLVQTPSGKVVRFRAATVEQAEAMVREATEMRRSALENLAPNDLLPG